MTRGRLAATTGFAAAAFACATAAVTAEKAAEPAAYQWDLPKGFPRPRVPASNPMNAAKVGSSLFGVGCVRATGAMPAELDPLARRRCRPTGGVAPTSSFMVLVFL